MTYLNKKHCIKNQITDYGKEPYILNIKNASIINSDFRTAIWTGTHLQATLMSICVGEDIGAERHDDTDQLLIVESSTALLKIGNAQNSLTFQSRVGPGSTIFIPAGTWHNVINTGSVPLKLLSVYAPPQHTFGTIHKTKQDAENH